MLLTKEICIKWLSNNKKQYENLGYVFTKHNNKILIKIEHLSKNSHYEVDVLCDYCNNEYKTEFCTYNKKKSYINKDACKKCKNKKMADVNLCKYGVIDSKQKDINIKNIKNEFKYKNCILIDELYINSSTLMSHYCLKHPNVIQKITYKNFKNNRGCKFCGVEIKNEKISTPIKDIENNVITRGYKFIEIKNIKNRRYIVYVCPKHSSEGEKQILLSSFNQGHGCKHCHIERMTGETNPLWKGCNSQ